MTTFVEDLHELIESTRFWGRWTKFQGMEVYMRRSWRKPGDSPRVCIDLATLNIADESLQRKGTFTALLAAVRAETDLPIYVENAFREFAEALEGPRYGFKVASDDGYSKCLYRLDDEEQT